MANLQKTGEVPSAFIWRRMHSLFGLLLVGFLIMHLVTNAQAALLPGDDGEGFIHHVNQIHSLPFLPVIEIGVLGLFFAIHAWFGIRYLLQAKPNSCKTDGSKPSLGEYGRNKAYTWQRLTSWFLVVLIIGHVVHMRVLRYPIETHIGQNKWYIVRVSMDRGLYTLADRLKVAIYDQEKIAAARLQLPAVEKNKNANVGPVSLKGVLSPLSSEVYRSEKEERLQTRQHFLQQRKAVSALEKMTLSEKQVAVVAPDAGTAILLTVRDSFKYPLWLVLYTIFVPIATFHACNGLWTGLITWGVTLTEHSQLLMKTGCRFLMWLLNIAGWVAIWGTYWFNLRY